MRLGKYARFLLVFCAACGGDDGAGGAPDASGDRTSSVDGAADAMNGAESAVDAALDAAPPESGPEPTPLEAILEQAQVVTAPTMTGASGHAALTLSADGRTLTYDITQNVANATAIHVHVGYAALEEGAPSFSITPAVAHVTGTLALTPEQAAATLARRAYVEVVSFANPAGEIRGQVLAPGDSMFVASLTGAQETPPVQSQARGTAMLVLDGARSSLLYHVATSGVAQPVTSIGARRAIAGEVGALAYGFSVDAAKGGADGTAAFQSADAEDVIDGRFYVNVATTASPAGLLRGQLHLPGESLYVASLSPMNEVPPVMSPASGFAQFLLSFDQTELRFLVDATTPTAITSMDIRVGTATTMRGSIAYMLPVSRSTAKGRLQISTVDVTDLTATPPGWYLEVATTAYPMGEERAQIIASP